MAEKHGFLQRFTVYDLVLIAVMATLGIVLKPIIVPIAHLVSGPLMIPAGALAGGLYMLWLVVGFGLVGKYGTATLIGLIQALVVMFTGVIGSHGILTLASYTASGIIMDLGLLLIGHRVCCRSCAFIAGLLANITGTFVVNFIFFRLPLIFLLLTLAVAALSGGVGGLLAWQLLQLLDKYHLRPKTSKRQIVTTEKE
jgi:hypothetical protein